MTAEIDINIKFKSLVTIGSGEPSSIFGADVTLIRIPYGDREKYFIPGSTIKGILRTSACRVAHLLGLSSCGEVEPSSIVEKHNKLGDNCIKIDDRKLCHVCYLFGYPGSTIGNLFVSNAYPVTDPLPFTITRVCIDDKKLTAVRGKLFTYEVYPANTVFAGSIKILLDDEWAHNLVLAALLNLNYERIGRGGLMEIEIVKTKNLYRSSLIEKILNGWGKWKI